MKHLKAKLMATVMSLVLATAMLTSASFAWFTISTAPEISDMETSVTANGNLEIALDAGSGTAPSASTTSDAGKNTTWGNLVSLKGYFDAATITLKPVDVTFDANGAATVQRPTFGNDGRISGLTALTRASVADGEKMNFKDMNGVFAYTDTVNIENKGTNDEKEVPVTTGAAVWCYEVDYWVRTNMDGAYLVLSDSAHRGDADSEMGLGSWITNEKVTVKLVDVAGETVYTLKQNADDNGNAVMNVRTDNAEIKGEVVANAYSLSLYDTAETPAAAKIALTKNEAKLLKMYVYMDGAVLTNADFENTTGSMQINVQFSLVDKDGNAISLTPMSVAEDGYGRDTAGTIS